MKLPEAIHVGHVVEDFRQETRPRVDQQYIDSIGLVLLCRVANERSLSKKKKIMILLGDFSSQL